MRGGIARLPVVDSSRVGGDSPFSFSPHPREFNFYLNELFPPGSKYVYMFPDDIFEG